MKLKDTGLTVQDIKDKVSKYMIETYERFDFLAETAEGMYLYDEKVSLLFACFMCYLWTDAAKDRDNYKQYYEYYQEQAREQKGNK